MRSTINIIYLPLVSSVTRAISKTDIPNDFIADMTAITKSNYSVVVEKTIDALKKSFLIFFHWETPHYKQGISATIFVFQRNL